MAARPRRKPAKRAASERPDGRRRRVAVLRSRFNAAVVDGLAAGAVAELRACGVPARGIETIDVPGAFELPLAAAAAATSGRFDALVALGAVIRGQTDHYEHVAREASSGLAAVSLETGVPVGFGVLTVTRMAHALARSAPGPDNKGAEAARAALAMTALLDSLRRRRRSRRPRGAASRAVR